jgi:3-hydroxyisobutyrate dehydrogenase
MTSSSPAAAGALIAAALTRGLGVLEAPMGGGVQAAREGMQQLFVGMVNLLWFGQAIATAEALLIARRAGLDLDVVRQALAGSAAASAFLRDDLGAMLSGDYLTSFGLDRCCEELAHVTALAREHDVPAELAGLVERTYQRALDRFGPVGGELLAVALLEEEAGTYLRQEPG